MSYLATGEANGYDTEVLWVREEPGLDHGSVHGGQLVSVDGDR